VNRTVWCMVMSEQYLHQFHVFQLDTQETYEQTCLLCSNKMCLRMRCISQSHVMNVFVDLIFGMRPQYLFLLATSVCVAPMRACRCVCVCVRACVCQYLYVCVCVFRTHRSMRARHSLSLSFSCDCTQHRMYIHIHIRIHMYTV